MNLEETMLKIMEKANISREQIKEKIDAQIQELSGLIDEEGAIVIVAKNLGVDLKENKNAASMEIDQKIVDLKPNTYASIVGRIVNIGEIRTFNKKDGSEGVLLPFIIEDTSAMVRCVAWGQFNTQIINETGFLVGEIIRIVNGSIRTGKEGGLEIHVGNKSRLQLQPDNLDQTIIPKKTKESLRITKLDELSLSLPFINIEAIVSNVFSPKSFTRKDGSQGQRASLSVMADNQQVFITFWGEHCSKLENVQLGNLVQITDLTPKTNYKDKTKIDLTATSKTKIIIKSTDTIQQQDNATIDTSEVKSIKYFTENIGFGSLEGKIQEIEGIRTISTKDGRQLELMNLILADETGAIRINLWDDKVDPDLEVNGTYRFENVSVKLNSFTNQNEASLSKTGQIVKIDRKITTTKTVLPKANMNTARMRNIEEINQSEFVNIKATLIKDISRINTYVACSNCNRKKENCQCQTPGEAVNRMIVNLVLDDETGVIRATLMGERAENFLNTTTDRVVEIQTAGELDNFLKTKSLELVGKEFLLRGKTRYSNYSENYEMNINSFEEIDSKEEIQSLFESLES